MSKYNFDISYYLDDEGIVEQPEYDEFFKEFEGPELNWYAKDTGPLGKREPGERLRVNNAYTVSTLDLLKRIMLKAKNHKKLWIDFATRVKGDDYTRIYGKNSVPKSEMTEEEAELVRMMDE
jgi:hypothetical protein